MTVSYFPSQKREAVDNVELGLEKPSKIARADDDIQQKTTQKECKFEKVLHNFCQVQQLTVWRIACAILALIIFSLALGIHFGMFPTSSDTKNIRRGSGCSGCLNETTGSPTTAKECFSGYTFLNATGYCYKVVTSKVAFGPAESACRAEGAHLASIHSMKENRLLANLSRTDLELYPAWTYDGRLEEQNEVIIGLRYKDGEWEWTDGSYVDFQYWGVGEPTIFDNEWITTLVTTKIEVFNPAGEIWNIVPASSKQRAFICKKGIET